MQKIYPEIKKIKEEYKYDKKEQQQQMMQLYSKHNANPLMGCLPLLIQSPFFISLFRVLESISHWTLNNHTTLYGPFKGNRTLVESAQHAQIFGAPIAVKITDSHEKLALMNANPLYAKLTIAFMIGVVLAIQIVSQRTMMKMQAQHATVEAEGAQKLQSKLIMYLLPIGTIFFGINMSAGVLLYWIVSYSFTFAQQTITLKVLHRNTIIQEKK
jgi:YidC/Oxa1 family membrane protein insertase